ncbi:MAG: penicillin-binding protein 2 [Coriobacteriales bacterium]|nr:penicillin-binding protein 2 [Coriobacteriales bacterium]
MNAEKRSNTESKKFWVILILFGVLFLLVTGKLFIEQIINGPAYSEFAYDRQVEESTVYARRGNIYDRNGEVIASSVDSYTVYIKFAELYSGKNGELLDRSKYSESQYQDLMKERIDSLSKKLFEFFGQKYNTSYSYYYDIVSQDPKYKGVYKEVYVHRNVNKELGKQLYDELKEKSVGVYLKDDLTRIYPNGTIGQQVIGTVALDEKEVYNGTFGLEKYYEDTLKGTNGKKQIEAGVYGTPVASKTSVDIAAISGKDITTSLDIKLQEKCENSIKEAVERLKAENGSVIVMDSNTGEIYSCCSYGLQEIQETSTNSSGGNTTKNDDGSINATTQETPTEVKTYTKSGNKLKHGFDVGALSNITTYYEPGSTFKSFTAVSVLENTDDININSSFYVPSSLEIADAVITDSHYREAGSLTFTQILAQSSNIGSYMMSKTVGAQKLYDTYSSFGFGNKTGVDYPFEWDGELEETKDWDDVQRANIVFGQGVTTTGIQICRGYCAIKNGGVMHIPHFLTSIANDKELSESKMEEYRKPIVAADAGACNDVATSLLAVTEYGTARNVKVEGHSIAGKTGTAEYVNNEGKYETKNYITSFVGWLANTNSNLVCLVIISKPESDIDGGAACGPVFADIMNFASERYNIVNK